MCVRLKYATNTLLLAMMLCVCGRLGADQAYTLSAQVEDFANKNKLGEKVGSSVESVSYKDDLTALDLIARVRADVLHRGRNVLEEDYDAAGWTLCFLPWTPPKEPSDIEKMKKLRPTLVDGVFMSEERRKKLVERLNRDRLALSADQIKEQHLKPWDFFNIKNPEKVQHPPA